MPRRPATIERDIPLFLIPPVVVRGVRTYGEVLERVIVRKTSSRFSKVSIRTRPVRQELERVKMRSGSPLPARSGCRKENQ